MFKISDTYNNSIPSNTNRVCDLVSEVLCYLQNRFGPVEECTLFELRVILNEIVLNAIIHGNNEDEGKLVKLTACLTEDGFACLVVEDEGNGYNYECLCANRAISDEENDICSIMESGRGILIVSNLCDRIKVNSRGNKIVVLKKLKKV